MKKKIAFQVLLTCFALLPLISQAQGWQFIFDDNSTGYDVEQTQDGNLVFLGRDNENGGGDQVRLYKTDLNGNEIWTKQHLIFQYPEPRNLTELPNGELLVVGQVSPAGSNGPNDIFLLHTDADGNQIAYLTYPYTGYYYGSDVLVDTDGNYLIIGSKDNTSNPGLHDIFVIKSDPAGSIIWTKSYGFAGYDFGNTAELLPNGDILVMGSLTNQVTESVDALLLRLDSDGNQVWAQLYGDPDLTESIGDLCPSADGNFFLAMQAPGQFNQTDMQVRKIAPDGSELWVQNYLIDDVQIPNSIVPTADGGYLLGGRTNATGANVIMLKCDSDGNLEWEKIQKIGVLDYADRVITLDDGGYAFCGRGNINFGRMYIGRTDNQGSVYSNEVTGRIVLDSNDDCLLDSDPDGKSWGVELLGANNFSTIANANGEFSLLVDTGIYQVVITPLGINANTIELCQPIADLTLSNFYEDTPFGDIIYKNIQGPTEIISGYVFYDLDEDCEPDTNELTFPCVTVPFSPEGNFNIVYWGETDENGYYEVEVPIGDYYYPGEFWWNTFWNCDISFGCNIDGGYVTTGQPLTLNIPLACEQNVGVVSGYIFLDDDNDCAFDTLDETVLDNWEVVAVGTSISAFDSVFSETLANGIYNLILHAGDYDIYVRPPNGTWESCIESYSISTNYGDCDTGLDFPIQVAEQCPFLEVDISTNQLRPCFQSTYFMQYCNLGSETATDTYIEVTLDSAMQFVSSPFPVTQSGQVLTFDIGDVEPLDCQTINFNIFLDCDAMTGLTHCVEAHIFPDTTCVPLNPLWDMSSVQLAGKCEGDSVTFIITNVGTGNMSQSQDYIVIEDNVLIRSDQFQLPIGADSIMVFHPDGATLRLEAEQSAFHPGNSMPSITLEGCGVNTSNGISTGFVIQMPEDDLDPFVSIECLESGNSFDPNDKQGFPKGIGENHFIRPNTQIEYKIRYQNTGTAPALNVTIRDTLSAFLDASSLRPGVSSHDYEYELENGNVAVFTFEGINLPDSTANLEESMGFVKFKIEQTTDNQPGTQILNSAAIYFDFNPPIITNVTEHQIPFPVEEQFFASEICLGEKWMGFEITGDTAIYETINYPFFEEETTYQVTALGHSFFEQNISLIQGQTYNEIVITSDTVFIENLTAANGCDSTATTYITVLPNSASEALAGLYVNVFPNPAADEIYIDLELSKAMEIDILLTDALGRNLLQILENQFLTTGKERIKIELPILPTGVYFLQLRTEAGVRIEKVNMR